MLNEGDVIVAKPEPGKKVKVTLIRSVELAEHLWWVRDVDSEHITVYSENDLIEWNTPRPCDCGSIKTNQPGHSDWCNYNDV